MSDLFVGEILVLSLLLPVLLRPFFRRLQRVMGIPLLPLLALLLSGGVIAVSGLRLTFLPVFALTLLVFFSGIARLFRLFGGLPTDWFSPAVKVYYGFLALLFVGVAGLTLRLAPEPPLTGTHNVTRTLSSRTVSRQARVDLAVWQAAGSAASPKNDSVFVFEDLAAGRGGRDTLALLLAEAGYTVYDADWRGARDFANPSLSFAPLRRFSSLSARTFAGLSFPASAAELDAFYAAAIARFDEARGTTSGRDFAVAEGTACASLLRALATNPGRFAGVVCLCQDAEVQGLVALAQPLGGSVRLSPDSGMISAAAGAFPVCILSGGPETLIGSGELGSDDVLAAALRNAPRDVGRKQAELIARRVESWLHVRRGL